MPLFKLPILLAEQGLTLGTEVIVGGFSTVVAGLGVLWRMIVVKAEETETKLQDSLERCEEDRERQQLEMKTMAVEFGIVKGKLEILSEHVLRKVNSDDRTEPKTN